MWPGLGGPAPLHEGRPAPSFGEPSSRTPGAWQIQAEGLSHLPFLNGEEGSDADFGVWGHFSMGLKTTPKHRLLFTPLPCHCLLKNRDPLQVSHGRLHAPDFHPFHQRKAAWKGSFGGPGGGGWSSHQREPPPGLLVCCSLVTISKL